MNKYVCSKCDTVAKHSKETGILDEKSKATHAMSLGTWRCPTHGKVSAKRVKQ